MKSVWTMRDCRGSAILVVITFIFVLSLTGMAILYLYGRHEIMAINDTKEAGAYQAAQSGLELARAWLQNLATQQNKFPEQINNNRDSMILFTDASHPDGTWVLSDNIANPALGTQSYRVSINPCADNQVDLYTLYDGHIGNYVVISTGIVSTGISGTYDYVKVSSETIRMHRLGGVFYFRVVDRSWIEEPLRHVKHP